LTPRAAALPLALLVALSAAAAAAQSRPVQLLPLPSTAVPRPPAPIPPPINPGYAAAPTDGLSPVLSQSVPLYELPAPASPSYPPLQLPGPVDQQKLQAYRNNLYSQQWQLQRQAVSPSDPYSREIQRQLNAPDAQ
jgi:hypothetical protein